MKAINVRKIHLYLALIFSIPLIIIIGSGIVLITKSFFPGIQAPIIEATKIENTPLAQISDFNQKPNVEQIIYRPNKNNIVVRYKNDLEEQYHAQTKELLHSSIRHTNWIIRLHQGSYFSEFIKTYVFIPTGIALLLLWITGITIYLKMKRIVP